MLPRTGFEEGPWVPPGHELRQSWRLYGICGMLRTGAVMRIKPSAWVVPVLGVVGLLSPATAHADERYYLLVFGSQSHPKLLRYTHTWATFVRVVGEGDDPAVLQVEQHTISWLPATLNVRTFSPFPERGVNLDLYQTLGYVQSNRESVTLWGPFVISPLLYQRSLRVKAIAESGAARYRAISTSSDMLVSDCIHAVAAVDPVFGRGHYPLIRVGKPASRYIARQVMTRSLFDQYRYDNSWLIPRLGLDRYGLEVIPPQQIPRRNCFLCRCPD